MQGILTFSNEQSRYSNGNAFVDFLAGGNTSPASYSAIKTFTQDSGRSRYYNRYKSVDLYIQDDWRATSRLTFNVGLRASLFGPWYNAQGTAYNWTPQAYNSSTAPPVNIDPTYGNLVSTGSGAPIPLNLSDLNPAIIRGLTQCGANGVPKSCMSSRIFFPGPRFGVSYDPWGNGKTAIHGGYGLFWEHGTGYEANAGSLIGSAPMILSETQSNIGLTGAASGVTAFGRIGSTCVTPVIPCPNFTGPGGASFPLNVTSIPTHAVYSYTQQWSLSVQREVHKNIVAQVAYVGTKGTHLTAVRDLNQLPAAQFGSAGNPFALGQPITPAVCQGGAG